MLCAGDGLGEVRGGRETVSHEPVIVLRIITRPAATSKFATNLFSTRQFFADVESGQSPTYSFIERQIIGWNHNDMHPPFGGLLRAAAAQKGAEASAAHFDPPLLADRRRGPARADLQRDPRLLLTDGLELPQHDPAGHLR